MYYVAMTRARRLLSLFETSGEAHPHTAVLKGPQILRRRPVGGPAVDPNVLHRRYDLLSLGDLHLSYPAYHGADHATHRALADLEVGSPLRLVAHADAARVVDERGRVVARLSREATRKWSDRFDRIVSASVLAVLERRREDAEPAYRESCRVDRWELPIIEVVWCPGRSGG